MAQCDKDGLKNECSGKLDDFIFIKSFDIQSSKKEYSYVFSKGTTYMITCCDESAGKKMVVELYDRDHKLIAKNFNEKKGQYFSKFGYQCQATGVYYMKYSFPDGDDCGVSVIGFKK